MSYLKEFRAQIANHDYSGYLKLWEEYCSSDEVDGEELKRILSDVRSAGFADSFGRHVERAVPLWKKIENTPIGNEVFKLIIDIQTSNSETLYDLACQFLHSKYAEDEGFQDKIRIIGLRNREQLQGAISNYQLLMHMQPGNFVFHTGGWGVGEIMEVSFLREQLSLEFDYVACRKDLSFAVAFKTLIPIPKEHFLALRFGDPDLLEERARKQPVEVIRMLLRDLGSKSSAEIKEELCELVIPAKEWTRWWQSTRAKVKKDTMIESPDDTRSPFCLRGEEVSHEELLQKALEKKPDANTLIQMVHGFFKDFPETLKNEEFKARLLAQLTEMLSFEEITDAQELQIHFFLQDLKGEKESESVSDRLKNFENLEEIVQQTQIQAFKKRILSETRRLREDWKEIFLNLLYTIDQNALRDYIFSELNREATLGDLKARLEELIAYPARHPEALIWYFQKIIHHPKLPFADKQGKSRFFEAFLILLSHVEQNSAHRDLVKKMHTLLTAGRYAVVRQIMQDSSLADVKEFLLLATKCHSLSDHDIKIFHSLAEVVYPSIAKGRKKQDRAAEELQVIWTTEEGYQKLQKRIHQIGTVETVENAKEIEVARAHGDLRENAEFKAALERRDRLQSELKHLSDQLGKARIITREDIATDQVGVGTIVECEDQEGNRVSYTLLGPWDADPERNILSFQSKLAGAIQGLKVGSSFHFQGKEYNIVGIAAAQV